jgi:hypothetical protein
MIIMGTCAQMTRLSFEEVKLKIRLIQFYVLVLVRSFELESCVT